MISVVIPAFNEATRIGATLESLIAQTTTQPFEVIVVNNASTDDTGIIANRYKNKLNLRLVDQPAKGRGAARAKGFSLAKGAIVCSTDADTVVPPDWVDRLSAVFASPQIAAVTGTCVLRDCPPLTNAVFNFLQPNLMRLYRLFFGHHWLTGSNFAIRRSVYLAAGGFNPDVADLKDIDLGFRVKKIGRIKFLSTVPVTTTGHRFRGGLARGLWPYIKSFVARFWFHKELSR